jgi:hypothetical protein
MLRPNARVLRSPRLPPSVSLDVGVGKAESHIKRLALVVVSSYVIDAVTTPAFPSIRARRFDSSRDS